MEFLNLNEVSSFSTVLNYWKDSRKMCHWSRSVVYLQHALFLNSWLLQYQVDFHDGKFSGTKGKFRVIKHMGARGCDIMIFASF